MKFKLRQMEVFRGVMLTGSASGAARMLDVSQSVVSRMLTHLETTLDLQLFERRGGLLHPTENARIVFREIEHIYAMAVSIDGLVSNLKEKERPRISFISTPSLAIRVIPEAIRHHLDAVPEARFAFRSALNPDMPMAILGKSVDFGLTVWPIEHPSLVCERLFDSPVVIVVPRHHRLAAQDRVRLSDLASVPMIDFDQNIPCAVEVKDALAEAGIEALPVVEVNRTEHACSLVCQGIGVALVHRSSVDESIYTGMVVREIDVEIKVSIWLVTSKYDSLSDECRAFVDRLRP